MVGVERQPIGTGQMCDALRLGLTYDRRTAGPATLVAKLPAADQTSRATALALRSYETEVRFYQQLAPSLPVTTPAVHYADIDIATARFVLLLEDRARPNPATSWPVAAWPQPRRPCGSWCTCTPLAGATRPSPSWSGCKATRPASQACSPPSCRNWWDGFRARATASVSIPTYWRREPV